MPLVAEWAKTTGTYGEITNIISLVVFTVVWIGAVYDWLRYGPPLGRLVGICSIPFMIFAFILFWSEAYADRLLHMTVRLLGIHLTQLIMAGFVISAGWFAFRWKKTNQLWYGIAEVLFGAMSAVFLVSHVDLGALNLGTLTLTQYASMIGSAYVVARGLANVNEAREKNPPRPSRPIPDRLKLDPNDPQVVWWAS